MAGGPLTLAGLDRELARLGLPGHEEWLQRRRASLTTAPWTLVEEVDPDRRLSRTRTFADEDECCRTLLLDALTAQRGLPDGARRVHHDWAPVVPGSAGPGEPTAPPVVTWRRSLSPGSRGVLPPWRLLDDDVPALVDDTGSWWEHGVDGSALVSALDPGSGEPRWSWPVLPRDGRRWATLPAALLTHRDGLLSSVDPQDGTRRWTVGWSGDRLDALTASTEVLVLVHQRPAGPAHVGLDRATGAERWRRPIVPQWGWAAAPAERRPTLAHEAVAEGAQVVVRAIRLDDGRDQVVAVLPLPPGGVGRGFVVTRSPLDASALVVESPDDRDVRRRATVTADGTAGRWSDAPVQVAPGVLLERGATEVVGRVGGTTVVQHLGAPDDRRRAPWPREVVAVDDSGAERWRVPGGYARLVHVDVWVDGEHTVASYDVATGRERWRVPRDLGGPGRLDRAALDLVARARVDGHGRLVVVRDGVLVAYA